MYNSFIYIWYNKIKKMFYVGKHIGSLTDGYVCSSKLMMKDYIKNPTHFKRRILEYINDPTGSIVIERESRWLSLIKDNELGKKYYNLKNKNFANTKGCKKSYIWNKGLNKQEQEEYLELRKNKLFCLLSEKPKRGVLFKPIIKYVCAYCDNKFESKLQRKFCSPKCSSHWGLENGNIEKMKKALKGRKAWNKGLPNPQAAENGKKSAAKQAATVTGRRIIIVDGKRKWSYLKK